MSETHKRVLVVDDDEAILEAMQCALKLHGYEVLIARDGTEAMARVELDAPDLIVLDMIMPKRSGFSVVDHVRKRPGRGPRIIMVTGDPQERHREFAAARGVDAFVDKPFDMDRILREIDRLLKA